MQTLVKTTMRVPHQASYRVQLQGRSWSVCCLASAAQTPQYHILEYKYVPDILEKRGPHRAAHLAGVQRKTDQGKIVVGGAFGDPPEGALLIFKDSTKEEIQAFVAADEYVKNGLVPSWSIKPYAVVSKGTF